MPELPEIVAYVEALVPRIEGETLETVRVASPFLVRSVDPPLAEAFGGRVTGVGRLGKRIAISLEPDLHLVLHLMVAGRLHWHHERVPIPGKMGLAAFDFSSGTLLLTEAGSKRRASLVLVRGAAGLAGLDPGGLEVLGASLPAFGAALGRESHTLKRALTDPRILSGVGNAYSDEILHAARLSPFALTGSLSEPELERLYQATQAVLGRWVTQLRSEVGAGFPKKVTAFREGMAVHGRFRKPCPVCGAPIQRVRYAQNEMNYCATCQTGGKLFADRALSRLLKSDWPRSLEEWEVREARLSGRDGDGVTPSPSTPGPPGGGS